MNQQGILKDSSPGLQVFLLICLLLIGLLVGTGLALLCALLLNHGQGPITEAISMQGSSLRTLVAAQMVSQIFTFVLPPLCFSYLITGSPFKYFLSIDKQNFQKYVIGFAIIFLAGFFLQFFIIDKATFVFPEWLKWLEESSRNTQSAYDAFIKQLVNVKSIPKLAVIFVMIAVLPAIGEELLFRGVIQKSIANWTKTEWPAIIISGCLFGLMHMEFFNFFALCFMGIVLGLLYSLTKNIWLTIFLHFMNNAISFITLYLYQNGKTKINPEEKLPIYLPLLAGVIMIALLYALYKKKFDSKENIDTSELSDTSL